MTFVIASLPAGRQGSGAGPREGGEAISFLIPWDCFTAFAMTVCLSLRGSGADEAISWCVSNVIASFLAMTTVNRGIASQARNDCCKSWDCGACPEFTRDLLAMTVEIIAMTYDLNFY